VAKVAFMTIGLLHEPFGDPRVQGFMERIETNFSTAKDSDGFLGFSQNKPDQKAILPKLFQIEGYENRTLVTLTLWANLESVFAFSYNGVHAEALSKRKEWFVKADWPSYVAWWVEDDHNPTWREACNRYDKLCNQGPSLEAFDFKKPFDPDGKVVKIDWELSKEIAAQHKGMKSSVLIEQDEIDALIKDYVTAWSEPDPDVRQRLLEGVWEKDGVYIDPMTQATTREMLNEVIAQFHRNNPGGTFTVDGKIEHHHRHVRFNWRLRFPNGSEVSGMDYGEVTPEGKLSKIVGFF
jgi:hypothetical protein